MAAPSHTRCPITRRTHEPTCAAYSCAAGAARAPLDATCARLTLTHSRTTPGSHSHARRQCTYSCCNCARVPRNSGMVPVNPVLLRSLARANRGASAPHHPQTRTTTCTARRRHRATCHTYVSDAECGVTTLTPLAQAQRSHVCPTRQGSFTTAAGTKSVPPPTRARAHGISARTGLVVV